LRFVQDYYKYYTKLITEQVRPSGEMADRPEGEKVISNPGYHCFCVMYLSTDLCKDILPKQKIVQMLI
jgi:hypothetical protein